MKGDISPLGDETIKAYLDSRFGRVHDEADSANGRAFYTTY